MFKKIKQLMSSDKNVSKFVFERASPMRFISEKERNRPFVNLKFRQHDAIDSYDAEVEDAKNFLGFEVKDEP